MNQHSDNGTGLGATAHRPYPACLNDPYFRTVWESTTEAMALSDPAGIVLAANAAYLELYGFPAEAVLGQSFAIIFPEAARHQALQNYQAVFTGDDTDSPVAAHRQAAAGRPYFAATIQRADGALRQVESRVAFIDEGGRRVALLSIIRDVTARAQAEATLHASETQLVRELEDTKTLHALSRLFIEEEHIDTLYEPLLTGAIALMGAACGSFQMLDEAGQTLRLLAWQGFHPEAAAYWQTVTCDSSTSCGSAFRRGERVLVPDVRTSELLAGSDSGKYYALSGIVAVQSTPLIARNRSSGGDDFDALVRAARTERAGIAAVGRAGAASR